MSAYRPSRALLLVLALSAIPACDGRAVPVDDTEATLTGTLCSSQMMQAVPWVAEGGVQRCWLDAFLATDSCCSFTADAVRLCSSELPSPVPLGQPVALGGAFEEAEICMMSGPKGEGAKSCTTTQRFVPASVRPQ